jgi:hypothetical protein
MEAKDPKSTETSAGGDDGGRTSREPDSDATSDETLEDIESEEKVVDSPDEPESGSASAGTPSPDGAFDDNRGDGGGVGPM